jgi:hypothetical protein
MVPFNFHKLNILVNTLSKSPHHVQPPVSSQSTPILLPSQIQDLGVVYAGKSHGRSHRQGAEP